MMTNAQLYLAIGLPTLAVLASLTVSLVQIWGIRGELLNIRQELVANRSEVRADIRSVIDKIDLLTGKVARHR
jgi:hypothetical protein